MADNGIGDRVSGFARSFSPQQLAIIGVLGVLTLVGGLAFFNWISAPSSRVLATGLTPDESNEVVEALNGAGIGYDLADGGTTVMVPEASLEEANLALAGAGVGTSTVVGYEIFDDQSFTSSDFQQQIGYQRAIQGELTRSIMAMDGIDYASVQLGIPADRLFVEDQQAVTAGILVEGSRGTVPERTVEAIVQLAASSVPGLEPEHVTVTDTGGNVLTGPGATSGGGSSQLEMTQAYETMLAARIESMLAQVYGPGSAVVSVTADLSFDESETEATDYVGDPISIRESLVEETFTGSSDDAQGIAGVEGAEVGSDGGTTDYQSTETVREQVVDSVVTRERLAPGRVERVSVALMVDENPILRYETAADAGADAEPEPVVGPSPDEQEITELITAGLGLRLDPEDPTADQLDVLLVDFPDLSPQEFADAEAAAASAGGGDAGGTAGLDPVDIARTALGGIVLLLALFFLRKGLVTRTEPVDPEAVAGALPNGPRPAGALGAATKETLALPSELRLIDQDPDQVATLLREWVADRRV